MGRMGSPAAGGGLCRAQQGAPPDPSPFARSSATSASARPLHARHSAPRSCDSVGRCCAPQDAHLPRPEATQHRRPAPAPRRRRKAARGGQTQGGAGPHRGGDARKDRCVSVSA
eukprot:365783-Chlamydomonas_euryale.AAC.18